MAQANYLPHRIKQKQRNAIRKKQQQRQIEAICHKAIRIRQALPRLQLVNDGYMVAMNLSRCDHPHFVNTDRFAEFIPIGANIVWIVVHFDSEIQGRQFIAAAAADSSGNTMPQALRGCRVAALGAMHYMAVAAPGFALQHVPSGLNRSNFKNLPFLSYTRKDDMQRVFVARAMGLKTVGLHQLFVPNSEAQVRAVAAGWGIGVVPELLARPFLADGRLVNVAESQVLRVDLYWHCWNLQSALLSQLTEAMLRTAKASLAPATPAARATASE